LLNSGQAGEMVVVEQAIAAALADVGPRLRRLRTQRNVTLTALAETTGISKSTLSRLESGQRKPSLELLLPIAQAHRVPIDELVGAPQVGDPRVRLAPRTVNGRVVLPLTPHAGSLQAWKVIIPADQTQPDPRVHEGYEWLYVLSGRLRLVLGDHDFVIGAGEAAEFDTRLPHWFGSTGDHAVEIISILGRQGERIHVRARSK
jgi:transcriptional regulator with XRE-family HTH domain